jgi:hypothetical protein
LSGYVQTAAALLAAVFVEKFVHFHRKVWRLHCPWLVFANVNGAQLLRVLLAFLSGQAPHSAQLTFRDAQGATPLMTAVTSGLPAETLNALIQVRSSSDMI